MKTCTIGYLPELDYSGTEALNTICSNLLFTGQNMKKIVMTSCSAGDGKSYLTMHTAQNLAGRGKRVCIVDADLRRSMVIRNYAMETEGEWIGLAHYLAGYNSMDDIIYQTNIEGLCYIPIGRDLVNPIQLLDSQAFDDLLKMLTANFDIVLVDAPPVGLVIDAAVIAGYCDGCIFVIEYNHTKRRDINEGQKQIEQSGCAILGCVINNVKFDSISAKRYYNRGYYKHYYSKYYTKDGKKTKKKK